MQPNPLFVKISALFLPLKVEAQNFGLLRYFFEKLAQRKQSGHPDPD
jgi:hypothetical protein